MAPLLNFKSSAKFLPLFLLLTFTFLSAKTNQAELPAGSKKQEWNWLSQDDQARLLKSIPPPPTPGSAEDKSDLEGVVKMQAARTSADIAEANYDEHFRLGMISKVLDPQFTEDHFPTVFALLKQVDQDEYLLNITLKKKYRRPRPYQASPQIKALFPVDGYSYPSGHASGSRTLALVMALFFPEKKNELLARSDAVGRSRIVAGVHYPSDVAEGKKLADVLVDALQTNTAFKHDLAAAQAEIAQKK